MIRKNDACPAPSNANVLATQHNASAAAMTTFMLFAETEEAASESGQRALMKKLMRRACQRKPDSPAEQSRADRSVVRERGHAGMNFLRESVTFYDSALKASTGIVELWDI
jgi:hypothetical protein